jgi:hypothetical protein
MGGVLVTVVNLSAVVLSMTNRLDRASDAGHVISTRSRDVVPHASLLGSSERMSIRQPVSLAASRAF